MQVFFYVWVELGYFLIARGETDGDGPFVSAIAATERTVPADSRNCKDVLPIHTSARAVPAVSPSRKLNAACFWVGFGV